MNYRTGERSKKLKHIISGPFIFAPLPFFVMMHIIVEIYHQVGFRLYGLERVNRKDHMAVFDRGRLEYLSPMQKIGCIYCGYANGLLRYTKEIAGRTEKYWCGIMHKDLKVEEQTKREFVAYDDKEALDKVYPSS